jgi:UDP-glucose 4-epimerase
MKNILITGGAGFIPSSLADALLKRGYKIFLLDNLVTGKKSNIPKHKNCEFFESDVNDYDSMQEIMNNHDFEYIFHYASLVGVERTIENPLLVLDDINGLKNVFNLSSKTGVKKIFYSSSSEVYGEPVEIPQNEELTALNARLPYAVVKNIGECFCKAYQKEYGLNYSIFRFFNTYGERQSSDFVVSKFINAALNNHDITINGDGLQTRTFCYIDDNIDATINAFEGNMYNNDIANIGNDAEISILQLAMIIKEITGSSSKIVHRDPLEEGDMTRRQPDVIKMIKLLGRDFTKLEDGLLKILPKFESNVDLKI